MNNESDLVGKILRDTDGREYHITAVLSKGGQGIVFRTAEDFLIKINTSADKEKYGFAEAMSRSFGESVNYHAENE